MRCRRNEKGDNKYQQIIFESFMLTYIYLSYNMISDIFKICPNAPPPLSPLMLLLKYLCSFAIIRLQFLSMCLFFLLSFGFTHSALVEISIPGISEICSLDFRSDFNLSHAIYNFCEMLCSESCSEYEAPHMVYYESEFPEFVPSSHGICLISRNFDSEFSELVQSLHWICMISRNFDGEFLELDQSSHHICMIFRNVDKDFCKFTAD